MNIQERSSLLLNANANNSPVEGGLYLSNALQQVQLDYSENSLKRIDALLDQLREKLKPELSGFMEDMQKENFALTLVFYLGEYVARQTKQNIVWLSYEEAIKRIPSEQTPQKDFYSNVVGFIGKVYLMPLVVLDDQLFNGTRTLNAYKYVSDAIQTIEGQFNVIGDEWHPEYLERFLNNQKITGGIAFIDALKLIKMDFSQDSLKSVDELLVAIRREVRPDYNQFVSKLNSANFVWLLSTYLARVIAQSANCSLKWLTYDEGLIFAPGLKRKFESTLNCILGDRVTHPMQIINEILFAPATKVTCMQFAETLLASDIPPLVSLFRDAVIPHKKKSSLFRSEPKMVWQAPIHQAGFLAAHGAFMLQSGLDTPPVLLQPNAGGQHMMIDFSMLGSWEAANEQGQSALKRNPNKLDWQAYLFEGYANLPHSRLDAMVIDLRCYTKPTLELSIAIPFTPTKSAKGFKIFAPTLMNCSAPESLVSEIAIAFYEGVDSNKVFDWDRYLVE